MNVNFRKISFLPSLIVLVFIWTLVGCEKDLYIEESNEKRTVINGTFNPNSLWEINVSKSKNIIKDTTTDFIIRDAVVKVLENNLLVDSLIFSPPNNSYRSTLGHYPEINKEYKLQVEITGEKKITAMDEVPDTSILFSENAQLTSQTTSFVEFRFSIADMEIEHGFFHLAFFENVYNSNNPNTILRVNQLDDFLINDYNDNFNTEPNTTGIKLINSLGYLYDDTDLNGTAGKVIYVRVPFDALEQGSSNNLKSEICIELRTTSFNYYKFYKDLTEQVNSENPIAFPVSVHNNINDGIGNFSSYSSVKSCLKLQ